MKNSKIIIGISGRKQAGKTTLCEFLKDHSIYKHALSCKICYFAHSLKNMCMDILGLTWEQCYGTDEQKNTFTDILWDKFPRD